MHPPFSLSLQVTLRPWPNGKTDTFLYSQDGLLAVMASCMNRSIANDALACIIAECDWAWRHRINLDVQVVVSGNYGFLDDRGSSRH